MPRALIKSGDWIEIARATGKSFFTTRDVIASLKVHKGGRTYRTLMKKMSPKWEAKVEKIRETPEHELSLWEPRAKQEKEVLNILHTILPQKSVLKHVLPYRGESVAVSVGRQLSHLVKTKKMYDHGYIHNNEKVWSLYKNKACKRLADNRKERRANAKRAKMDGAGANVADGPDVEAD